MSIQWHGESSNIKTLVGNLGSAVWNALNGEEGKGGLLPHHYPLLERACAQAISPYLTIASQNGSYIPADEVLSWMLCGEWKRFCGCSMCNCGAEVLAKRAEVACAITESVEALLVRMHRKDGLTSEEQRNMLGLLMEALAAFCAAKASFASVAVA